MKILKVLIILVVVGVSAPLIAYFVLSGKSYLEGESLAVLEGEAPSKYFFKFDGYRNIVISDEYNKFVRSWGGSPNNIEIVDGVRFVTFTEAAILKTSVDSIEPHEEYVKVKGHMGIITKDTEFTVNSEGVILSNEWSGG